MKHWATISLDVCWYFQNVTISFAGTFNIENDVKCTYDFVNVMGDGGISKHGKYEPRHEKIYLWGLQQ